MMSLSFLLETAADALLDNLGTLPFLFLAFLILESIECRADRFVNRIFRRRKAGPAVGALLGCIPQCGCSAMISGLYCGGAVTAGTLLSVYLSTSDEALLVLMTRPDRAGVVLRLLLAKLIIAVIAGYLTDLVWKRMPHTSENSDDRNGSRHGHRGILLPALGHTVRLFLFVFLFTWALNVIIALVGLETLSGFLLSGSVLQPFLTALIGLIPNCAASVLVAQLYLEGAVTFGSAVSGLSAGAGVGLIVLFRTNRNRKENLIILGLLYLCAVLPGILLQLIF